MVLENRFRNELEQRSSEKALRKLTLNHRLTDFCSNDYLSLSGFDGITQNKSNSKYGSGGSRLLAGNDILHEELELLLAKVHKADAALLFNSGYVANLGLFASVPKKGDVVLDPMCGSGTTCRMAKVLNRKFIGIDISGEYVKLTEKRLKNLETKQKKLFDNY